MKLSGLNNDPILNGPSKTQTLIINQKPSTITSPSPFLNINNTDVNPISCAKYLGIHIDDTLS